MNTSNNLGDWEALAGIYLESQSKASGDPSTYCLCSRVFIKCVF